MSGEGYTPYKFLTWVRQEGEQLCWWGRTLPRGPQSTYVNLWRRDTMEAGALPAAVAGTAIPDEAAPVIRDQWQQDMEASMSEVLNALGPLMDKIESLERRQLQQDEQFDTISGFMQTVNFRMQKEAAPPEEEAVADGTEQDDGHDPV